MAKAEILGALSSDWQSTNEIAELTGLNWYRAESLLTMLYVDGKAELDEKPSFAFWRLKK